MKNQITYLLLATLALFCTRSLAQQPGPWDQRMTEDQALKALASADTPLHEKFAACRNLAIVGTKAAVPTLSGLLTDEKLSHMARYALEPIPDASVDAAFREALPKLKGRLLAGVINSIAKRRDAAATDALVKLLDNEDADVAASAAAALGKIGTPEAGKALEGALANASLKPFILDGCLVWAETAMAAGNNPAAIAMYDRLRSIASAPRQIKIAAARGAVLARGAEDGPPLLIEFINSADVELFALAQRLAIELPGPSVTQAITAELPKLTPDRQAGLITALGNRGDKAAVPAILTLAKTAPDTSVRIAAIRVLTQLKDPSALAFLVETASGNAALAKAARSSLASFPGKEADAAVMTLLDNPAQRTLAIELIGRRRLAAATPTLLKLSADTDETTRIAAIKALGDTASADQFPAITQIVLASSGPTLAAAETTLSSIAAIAPRDASADALVDAMPKANPAQKRTLMRALRSVGGPKALATVVAATKDADATTQDAAIRTLAEWTSGDAIEPLLAIAKSAQSPTHKSLALRGAMRLAADMGLPVDQRLAACQQAIPMAASDADKRLVLAALAGIPSPQALDMIVPLLDVPGVADEASSAALSVAQQVLTTAPQKVADAMTKVIAVTKNPDLKRRATNILNRARPR